MREDRAGAGRSDADLVRAGVARTARMAAAAGLVEAFGHVSARLPGGGLAITSTRPLHSARDEDVVVLDADGTPVSGALGDVPLETWLHHGVYAARPDVRAIVRGHPRSVVAWGVGGLELPVLHGLGLLAGRRVPVHHDVELVSDTGRAAAAAAALGQAQALVLRANGALAVGGDLLEAVTRLYALEERALVALTARAARVAPGDTQDWGTREQDSAVEMHRACRWFAERFAPREEPC